MREPECGVLKGAQAERAAGGAMPRRNPAGPSELGALSAGEACGMRSVAVRCVEIAQNPDWEGSVPCRH